MPCKCGVKRVSIIAGKKVGDNGDRVRNVVQKWGALGGWCFLCGPGGFLCASLSDQKMKRRGTGTGREYQDGREQGETQEVNQRHPSGIRFKGKHEPEQSREGSGAGHVYKEDEKMSNLESSERMNGRDTRILSTPQPEERRTVSCVRTFPCCHQILAKPTTLDPGGSWSI